MKLEKVDHKHALTSWLKVIIFSILMLVPFMDVAIRCGYVMFNKNAYQSYYGETINEVSTYSTTLDSLITNTKYKWTNQNFNSDNTSFRSTNYQLSYLQIDDTEYTQYEFFRFYRGSNGAMSMLFYLPNTTTHTLELISTQNHSVFIIISSINNYGANLYYDDYIAFDYYTYNSYSYLDNVFDYSVNKISESPLYSWTRNTAVYTGVNAMCNGLGMPTDLVAILLTYWFILTIIYIIIDIVLNMFVWLTHMFNRKAT